MGKLNERDLQRLQSAGKIRGYIKPKKPAANKKCVMPYIPAASPQKDWLLFNLQYIANENCLSLEVEHLFSLTRKWKFDYALPGVKIAVEYEGIFKRQAGSSGHTSITGVMRDIDKYNAAAIDGWIIIRCTANDYKQVPNKLRSLLKNKQKND